LFCIAHFKEREDFIEVIEKGLLLGKANFSEKGYMIDNQKFPPTLTKQHRLVTKERKKLMILSTYLMTRRT
jgi:hypothetical protein